MKKRIALVSVVSLVFIAKHPLGFMPILDYPYRFMNFSMRRRASSSFSYEVA